MNFGKFAMWYNHRHNPTFRHVHLPKVIPCVHLQSFLIPILSFKQPSFTLLNILKILCCFKSKDITIDL